MQSFSSPGSTIRPVQRRDLATIQRLQLDDSIEALAPDCSPYTRQVKHWFALVQLASWFPNPLQHLFRVYVAETAGQITGFIRVSPLNNSHSTWRIEQVAVAGEAPYQNVGTQLIRHSLEFCYEARTWLLDVDVNHKDAIALYRQNGFQPLANITDWEIGMSTLLELAEHQPDLPNLLAVNNADAQLLYQLDTAAMPPQIRQVYDLGINDFRCSIFNKLLDHGQHMMSQTQEVTGYVYEPQRKAAIGYFALTLDRSYINQSKKQSKKQSEPPILMHNCQLTVHPAYTWLYPELMSQMAQIITKQSDFNATEANHKLLIASIDYQPEREAYLEQIQAQARRHALLMARSVWHKVRESKPVLDALQLSRMLSGLQPAQKPVPGRINTMPPNHPEELP